jgi:hypothetical protein
MIQNCKQFFCLVHHLEANRKKNETFSSSLLHRGYIVTLCLSSLIPVVPNYLVRSILKFLRKPVFCFLELINFTVYYIFDYIYCKEFDH